MRRCFVPCTIDLRELLNLVADISGPKEPANPGDGIAIEGPSAADERTLAWIDELFGGWWSSEANVGSNFIARCDGAPIGFATLEPRGLRFRWLQGLAREPGFGVFGPFGVAPRQRGTEVARALLERGFLELGRRGYSRALICAVGDERLVRYYADCCDATVAERFGIDSLVRRNRRTVVLASGNGTNLQSVLDAVAAGALPLEIAGLVSNNANAFAIERGRAADLQRIEILPWKRGEEERHDYDARLVELVRSFEPDLVLLLGWMHLLADSFLEAFPETLNIHPAFLPLDPQRDDVLMPDGKQTRVFRGPRAVRDALAAQSGWAGATFHRITSHADRGAVLARKPLAVAAGETEEAVMRRLHPLEHAVVRAGITRWLYELPS